jgi:hypothetical protein
VASVAPAAAGAARATLAGPATSLAISGDLQGVAAASASDVWAVGSAGTGTLIVHWDGRTWKRVPSPAPAGSALTGVAVASARDAWAVGGNLILHWNGTAWTQVPSPGGGLTGVAAVSADDAWAVGGNLILHWNGKAWRLVHSPQPPSGKFGDALMGVAATSPSNAWAVGCTDGCPVGGSSVIERWQGRSWKQVAVPTRPFALYRLAGVATTSASSAWAVGGSGPVTAEGAETVRWNGHSWTLRRATNSAALAGVTAISARDAWAVGGTAHGRTVILHWNGTAWS